MAWQAIIPAIASVMSSVAQQKGAGDRSKAQVKADEKTEAMKTQDRLYESRRANISEAGEANNQALTQMNSAFLRALKR